MVLLGLGLRYLQKRARRLVPAGIFGIILQKVMILKHRDKELLRFEWVNDTRVRIISVNEAERRLLPLEFGEHRLTDEAEDLRYPLEDWLVSRSAPVARHFMRDLMDSLGININALDYHRKALDFSKGLSLNDVYWVVPDCYRGTWSEVNLYENDFTEAMAEIAFTGHGKFDPRKAATSPEMTTNGMLPKCWVREKDGIYLYKGAMKGLEPYSEFYAAQVAEALGLKHVKYELAKFKGRLCSKCKLFTSEKVGYLPASKLPNRDDLLKDSRFVEMFLFDAIIYNVDRHLGNFGFLVDNDTNEIIDVAPIFDNGYGLFPHLEITEKSKEDDFYTIRNYLRGKRPALFPQWLQLPYELTGELMSRLERLKKFRFRKHRHYNWDEVRRAAINEFLQKRISEICSFGRDADEKSEQSLVLASISPKENVGVKSSSCALNSSEERVARLILRNSAITESEIANQLSITNRQVERIIASLKKKAGLKRNGTDKVGEWCF